LSALAASPEKKRKLYYSDETPVGDPPLGGKQPARKAPAPQSNPNAMAKKVELATRSGGSGSGGFDALVKESASVAAAMTTKKVAEATTAKKATMVKRATEAAVVKKVTEEATAKEATEAVMKKKAAEEEAAWADTEKASDSTSAPEACTKRAATSMSGYSPPPKRLHGAWCFKGPRYVI
jgi:hypothetical protein